MLYNEFKGLSLSSLGMGTMRLPLLDSDEAHVNVKLTEEMVDYAMAHGVNYYDMAYGYHAETCEGIIGKCLNKYPRDSYYAVTKFPGYIKELVSDPKAVFETQLQRTGMDHFDFYLLHAVNDQNMDDYLNEEYGIIDYLIEEKRKGRIGHLGFSCHASVDNLEYFLSKRGQDMEFCQIQLNWLDWTVQDAKKKVEILRKYSLPIWVMEPVRGGKLIKLSGEDEAVLRKLNKDRRNVEWAFRFLQSIPEVTMILSGMSDMDQMKDNIEIFGKKDTLSEDEINALVNIGVEMTKERKVLCTACRYCTKHCPMELNIPEIMRLYNEISSASGSPNAAKELAALPDDKKPSACIECGSCARLCPQGIPIPEIMKRL